jgi:hypothetical protein
MLENSIWQQYHTTKTIKETLADLHDCDPLHIGCSEGELYAALKSHLTKKELRLFVMNEAGADPMSIMSVLRMTDDVFDKAMRKTYKKVRSNKIRKAAMAPSPISSE